nr:LOW QUALITY PROTEIN: uncharacterized protein LOC108061460 [Drosophila takahashii]
MDGINSILSSKIPGAPRTKTIPKWREKHEEKLKENKKAQELEKKNIFDSESDQETNDFKKVRRLRTVVPGLHSTLKSMHNLDVFEPHRRKKSAQYTDLFNKMLKGKASKISELNPLLKSTNRLKVASPNENAKVKTTKIESNRQMTKPFGEMLKGKETKIPELNRSLRSRFRIIPLEVSSSELYSVQINQEPIISSQKASINLDFPFQDGSFSKSGSSKTTKVPEVSPPSEKRIVSNDQSVPGSFGKIVETFGKIVTKEPEVSRHSETILEAKESRLSRHRGSPRRTQRPPKFQSSSSSDFDQLSLKSNRSSRYHFSSVPGKRINLKKFYHYIKNSMPDRKIFRQMNSKNPISYLKSEKSFFYRRSSPTPMDKSQRIGGSVISTADIAQSLLPIRKMEKKDLDSMDTEEDLFATFPEDYDAQDGLKKTINDIIAGIAKVEKARKKSQPKRVRHRSKSSKGTPDPTANRQSALSLRSVGEEVKIRENQAVRDVDSREQWQQIFYTEERAAVQARIQELMKEVAIREDFRPPKPPRDFVTENILRLRNIQPTKISQNSLEETMKPPEKYPTLSEVLTVPNVPLHLSEISAGIYNKFKDFAKSPLKPVKIRRYSEKVWKGQMESEEAEIKKSSDADEKFNEREKCDCCLCSLVSKGKDPEFIQKAKAQLRRSELRSYYLKMRRREWEQQMCCPKNC